METAIQRLESIADRFEQYMGIHGSNQAASIGGGSTRTAASSESPPLVKLYSGSLDGPLDEFRALSQSIGSDVSAIAELTLGAFNVQKEFLLEAVCKPKPDATTCQNMLQPTVAKLEAIGSFRDGKRTSDFFNHLSAVSEGIPVLGWVTVAPTPGPYIKELIDASQFYTNRILKDYKDKDQKHCDWVRAWLGVLNALHSYVRQNHTTGLEWNKSPGFASSTKVPTPPGVPPPVPCPPPPGPPPPPSALGAANGAQGDAGDDAGRAALLASLNKGLDITKGLKPVTKDMQTHKNPNLRAGGTVKDGPPPPIAPKPTHFNGSVGGATPVKSSQAQLKPVCQLEGGKKWIVENYVSNRNVVVTATDMKQVVYIYKCTDSVIVIKGKVNSITMDSCKKTSVVFDDLVSCMETINCQRAQIQTMGKMPTLTIQKTDGCQVYLSDQALDSEIVTSKSSEMNILVPKPNGDYDELAVPEQFKTVVKGNRLVTEAVDIA